MRSNSDESIGGLGFYAKIVGVVLVIGLAIFIGLLAFARAAYAWGFLGAFAVVSVILLGIRLDLRQAQPAAPDLSRRRQRPSRPCRCPSSRRRPLGFATWCRRARDDCDSDRRDRPRPGRVRTDGPGRKRVPRLAREHTADDDAQ